MPNGLAPAPALRLPRHDPPRPRPDARRRRERRLCRRLAHGLTPAQAARAENTPEAEVQALLADPDFAALAEEYRRLRDAPEAEQRECLRRLARNLLTEAVIDGDMRAACFVFREEARGRDPAATLADGVVKAARRSVAHPAPAQAVPPAPTPPPARKTPPPRTPADPVDRAAWRVAADLRDAVVAEHAVLHAAATAEPAAVEPVPAIPRTFPAPKARPPAPRSAAPAGPAPNRHERRRLAALRRGRDKRAGGLAGNRGPPR